MPASKAVLHDIHEHGLNPNKAHTLLGHTRRLGSLPVTVVAPVKEAEPVQPIIEVEQVVIVQPIVNDQDEVKTERATEKPAEKKKREPKVTPAPKGEEVEKG